MKPLSIRIVGYSLGAFFAITYTLCVIADLLFPGTIAMYQWWAPLLPGFKWISFGSFILGLVETFIYGFYVAIVFVPIYNYLQRRYATA